MENLNAEQIIKALECWASDNPCIGSACAVFRASTESCDRWIGERALSLIKSQEQKIKELTEDVEKYIAQTKELAVELDAMRGAANSYKMHSEKLTEENERLRAEKKSAIEDLEHCMYFAKPKRPNTCNFCTHDCEVSKDGTRCKGKEDWIFCSPVWRGFVKPKAEGE